MKKNLLFIVLSLHTLVVFSHDYQTVYSHRTLYFNNEYNLTEAIQIDSVQVLQNDSIIYPARGLQLVADNCFSPEGFRWLGQKIIVSPTWNYFFNETGDTIHIKTDASLNDTWVVYENSELIITGTLSKWETAAILGATDEVKTIMLHVYNANMQPLTDHLLEGYTIKIGKTLGLISGVNFLYFPSRKFSTDNTSHVESPFSNSFTLSGMTSPTLGVQNFTWMEAHDFQIGDEFHYQTKDYAIAHHNNRSVWIDKIVGRKDYLPDSVIYTIERVKADTTSQFISTQEGWSQSQKYNREIIKDKITPHFLLDALPGEVVYIDDNTVEFYSMYNSIKSIEHNRLFKDDKGCWSNSIIDDACIYSTLEKGLGVTSTKSGCHEEQSYSNTELVYYKKGNKTWGTQVEIYPKYLDKSPTWTFNFSFPDLLIDHLQQYYLNGDTTINNKTYKKVFISTPTYTNYYGSLREEHGRLYGFFSDISEDEEVMMYNYTLSVGDTLNLNYIYGTESTHLPSIEPILITKIDTLELLDNVTRKFFHTNRGFSYAESIGSTNGFLYPFFPIPTCICTRELICYMEDNIPLYFNSELCTSSREDCCNIIKANTPQVKQINFSISPNPTKDILQIVLNDVNRAPFIIKIFDNTGKVILVQQAESQEQTISVENLSSGIYLLEIKKGNKRESAKFIKQ